MSDDIDAFVRQFQESILAEARENYGEVFCRRWQKPLYMEVMQDADVHARLKGTCGDTILLFLKFDHGAVQRASFQTDGCAPSIVCGSYAAELCLGKSPATLLEITADTIIRRIGTLPEDVRHCAFLAAATVHAAVDRYMIRQVAGDA